MCYFNDRLIESIIVCLLYCTLLNILNFDVAVMFGFHTLYVFDFRGAYFVYAGQFVVLP